MKRSGKFYRNNERDVMRLLGLCPTPNSGSGEVIKEDGQSERIICQLKSTDAQSIKINLKDIKTLEYNAAVTHKIPMFAVQFMQTNDVYILFKPDDLKGLTNYLEYGNMEIYNNGVEMSVDKVVERPEVEVKESSAKMRKQFYEQTQKAREKDTKKLW